MTKTIDAMKRWIKALEAQPRVTREVWKDGIDIDVATFYTKLRDDSVDELRTAIAAEEAKPPLSAERAALIDVLRGGRQCDEEGAEIIMSRQACLEAADMLAADADAYAQGRYDEEMRQGPPQSTWDGMAADAQQVAVPQMVEHSDDLAVDRFSAAMKAKLARSRAKGRGGWDDPEQCTVENLSKSLHGHVTKGDPVDVANFCMMLNERGSGIKPAQQVAAPQGWNYLLQLSRQNYLRQFGASTTADWVYDDLIDLFDEGAPHPPQAERVPMAKIEKQSAWIAATIELPSQERCYLRGIADAEAHHHIRAKL